jgi:hypothetical protein
VIWAVSASMTDIGFETLFRRDRWLTGLGLLLLAGLRWVYIIGALSCKASSAASSDPALSQKCHKLPLCNVGRLPLNAVTRRQHDSAWFLPPRLDNQLVDERCLGICKMRR